MKTEYKKFAPYDRVLVKDSNNRWKVDFYSYFDNEYNEHHTMCYTLYKVPDNDILPYEGNEHLLGTTDDPEEEVELKEGEWLMVSHNIEEKPDEWLLRYFLWASKDNICTQSVRFAYPDPCAYNYAIRFSDFNPNDMEETKKHNLCVKNGKIIRYKE